MLEGQNIEYADDFISPNLNTSFWSTKRIRENRFDMVPGIADIGGPALKVTVEPGDLHEVGNSGLITERSELSERKEVIISANTNVWYAFSLYIPRDFVIADNRLVFANWKQESSKRSPALALRYKNGKVLFIIQSKEERLTFEATPIEVGNWQRFIVNFCIDKNHQGRAEAFLNGKSFATFEGYIGHPDDVVEAYFKLGIYRDAVPYTDMLYFAHFRRGLSKTFCELI